MRSAIMLAGGKGRRFLEGGGVQDKLLLEVNGEPLLRRAAKTALEVADELILAVDDAGRGENYLGLLSDLGRIRVVLDVPMGSQLPMAGVLSGIMGSSGECILVIPGDAAYVNRDDLEALMSVIEEGEADSCSPICDGFVQTLFQALEGKRARRTAPVLLRLDWRKPDGFLRGASRVAYVSMDKRAFITVNVPEDAVQRRRAGGATGDRIDVEVPEGLDLAEFSRGLQEEVRRLVERLIERRSFFWAGAVALAVGNDLTRLSTEAFIMEGQSYEELGISLLAGHAYADAARALRRAGLSPQEAREEIHVLKSKELGAHGE